MTRARALAIAALIATAGSGCYSQPSRPRDVIVIVVDTLRADRLGSYGGTRGLTPMLDRFAARGVRFDAAYAPCSWTMPSVASLFTSRLPSQHRVNDFDSKLADSEVTFAERLADGGFTTAGFTANWRLAADLGYGQGFGTWRGFLNSPGSKVKARGEVVREAALQWIDSTLHDGVPHHPRLLYLQYMEPHEPFEAPADLRVRFAPGVDADEAIRLNGLALQLFVPSISDREVGELANLYDAEVAAMDIELERLFDGLEKRGVLRDALVIVTADHGEEFNEHGTFGHGSNLFNTTVRVPLIMAGPGIPAGRVVHDSVSLIDLAPTILDVLGLPPEQRFEGRSLMPMLHGAVPAAGAPVDIVLQLPRKAAEWDLRLHEDGLVRGGGKVLIRPDHVGALYDLAVDPAEQQPHDAPAGSGLRAALDAVTAALAARRSPAEQKVVIDEATKKKLRALGYQAD